MSNVTKAGSYYLTGLAVECALKAILAQGVQQYDFPDKAFAATLYVAKAGNESGQVRLTGQHVPGVLANAIRRGFGVTRAFEVHGLNDFSGITFETGSVEVIS